MSSDGSVAIAALIVSLASSCIGSVAPSPYDLTLTIHCATEDIHVGDEIPIVFTITNRDQRVFEIDDRSGDRGGRMPEYELTATDDSGSLVPDPRKDYPPTIGGGLSGGRILLSPSGSFDKTIPLNLWSHITRPGTYVVAGIYRRSVRSMPIKIAVKGRSDAEMGRYVQRLVQELNSLPQPTAASIDDRRERLVERLAYTCDKRVVPTMLDVMYKDWGNNEVFWAVMAFTCYLPLDPEIREAVVRAAKSRGLGGDMQAVLEQLGCGEEDFTQIIRLSLASSDPAVVSEAVIAAQEHPSDEYMPRLIAIATDPNKAGLGRYSWIARARAIPALADNRTDEGVAALKALLNHPDAAVRRDANEAIRYAYRRHPIYPERIDQEYTATLVKAASDRNPRTWTIALSEILRTRTVEGLKAIKTPVADPNADIPQVRTDAGVQAVRDLLGASEPDVRSETRNWIAGVYREFPGRPLSLHDFPDELRENPEARKKAILQRLQMTTEAVEVVHPRNSTNRDDSLDKP
jgi:hypothetical protein